MKMKATAFYFVSPFFYVPYLLSHCSCQFPHLTYVENLPYNLLNYNYYQDIINFSYHLMRRQRDYLSIAALVKDISGNFYPFCHMSLLWFWFSSENYKCYTFTYPKTWQSCGRHRGWWWWSRRRLQTWPATVRPCACCTLATTTTTTIMNTTPHTVR